MAFCPAPFNKGMVASVIDTVDCHIRVLVQESYKNLVGPDTWFAAAFTGLLTLYIALLGYQILFGRGGLRVTELPFTAVKIGLILAFLSSWAAYQTVVFNLLFDGPAEIMKTLLAPLATQGSGFDGDVMASVESTFSDLSKAAGVYGGMSSVSANILQGGPMLGSGLLWLCSMILLLGTLGLIVATKIVLAFLLAVGPIFIGLLLFDATRGLFDGWFRATLSFALAPLAVNIFGAVMLMIMQPFVALLMRNSSKNVFDMGPVMTLMLIVAVFTIVLAFGLRAVAGIASGFGSRPTRSESRSTPAAPPQTPLGNSSNERAEAVASRIAMIDRNYGVETTPLIAYAVDDSRRTGAIADAVSQQQLPAASRLGQSYNRQPVAATPSNDPG